MTTCDECRETREALSDDALLCSACRLVAERAAGAAEERARIVAFVNVIADHHGKAACEYEDSAHGFAEDVLRYVAARIERGET